MGDLPASSPACSGPAPWLTRPAINLEATDPKATWLSLDRPYDCAIDVLPGTSLPKGPLYSLSGQEWEAMEEYIWKSLAAGIIRLSLSPAGAGFFFV